MLTLNLSHDLLSRNKPKNCKKKSQKKSGRVGLKFNFLILHYL